MDIIAFHMKNLLKSGVLMGIRNKDGLFIAIPKMNIDTSGTLYYLDSKKRRMRVSYLVFMLHGSTYLNNWMDSLFYIDKNSHIVSFKNYMINQKK